MNKNNILKHFPRHQTPRQVQIDTLLTLEKRWNTADIFVVNLPTASGKSSLATSLMHWQKQAAVLTPSKLLVDQYSKDFPYLHVLRAKKDYWCETFDCSVADRPSNKKVGKLCKKILNCTGCASYSKDVRKAHSYPYLLCNYYIFMDNFNRMRL